MIVTTSAEHPACDDGTVHTVMLFSAWSGQANICCCRLTRVLTTFLCLDAKQGTLSQALQFAPSYHIPQLVSDRTQILAPRALRLAPHVLQFRLQQLVSNSFLIDGAPVRRWACMARCLLTACCFNVDGVSTTSRTGCLAQMVRAHP